MSGEGLDVKDFTDDFIVEDAEVPPRVSKQRETDPHRIAQRQRQVDLGKNSLAYQRYRQQVPKRQRRREDPRTPDVHQACSKRSFEGQMKKWRRQLHAWDLQEEPEGEEQLRQAGDEAGAADRVPSNPPAPIVAGEGTDLGHAGQGPHPPSPRERTRGRQRPAEDVDFPDAPHAKLARAGSGRAGS